VVFWTIPTASVSVISISLTDRYWRIPSPVTSGSSDGGGKGFESRHSFGMSDKSFSRFEAPVAFQVVKSAMLSIEEESPVKMQQEDRLNYHY
jgi:hypothetical protein